MNIELFREQLDRALNSEEIAPQLNEVGIAREYLVKCVKDAESEIWAQVAEEERRVQAAQATLNNARVALRAAQTEPATAAPEPPDIPLYARIFNRMRPSRRAQERETVQDSPQSEQVKALQTRLEKEESTAEAALSIALDSQRNALLNGAILPFIRTLITNNLRPSYSTEMRVSYSPGLSEVFDQRYEISTCAGENLNAILSVIQGGSIGLAGPRGSGKTTLIESVGNGRMESLSDPVSLKVSAPVEYEPRDFVLHLFAKLCETLTGPVSYIYSHYDEERERKEEEEKAYARRKRRYRLWLYALWSSVAIGLILIAIGILSILHVKISWLSGALYIACGLLLPFTVVYAFRLPWRSIRSQARRSVESPPRLTFDEGYSPVKNLPDEERQHLNQLQQRALDLLENIRFQQTYTSGWSGTLKIPAVSATLSRGLSSARQTMSYPEVVSDLRIFLSDVAIGFRPIVVAIDELDKMESGEQARKFLNDIKGIFGVNGCYFLISVSVDAMSSFERRGMPFRDAFDSSFDDIVPVSPLKYADARAVINRRVIGVSEQFIALAHVISGGLARDLIRAMRRQVMLANRGGSRGLQALAAQLLKDEISAKLAAVEVALQQDDDSSVKEKILELTHEIAADDEEALVVIARTLRASMRSVRKPDAFSARLGSDLAVYLYFAATIMRFFKDSLDEERLTKAVSSGLLDDLAQCRQEFVMGAELAWQKISSCQIACQFGSSHSKLYQ
jgi:hypothetical protein